MFRNHFEKSPAPTPPRFQAETSNGRPTVLGRLNGKDGGETADSIGACCSISGLSSSAVPHPQRPLGWIADSLHTGISH